MSRPSLEELKAAFLRDRTAAIYKNLVAAIGFQNHETARFLQEQKEQLQLLEINFDYRALVRNLNRTIQDGHIGNIEILENMIAEDTKLHGEKPNDKTRLKELAFIKENANEAVTFLKSLAGYSAKDQEKYKATLMKIAQKESPEDVVKELLTLQTEITQQAPRAEASQVATQAASSADSRQTEADARLATLSQELSKLETQDSSADMTDAEYARYLQRQEEDLARQEAADAEYARKLDKAQRTGTTGALQEARTFQLQPESQRSGGMSRGGDVSRSGPNSDEEDC